MRICYSDTTRRQNNASYLQYQIRKYCNCCVTSSVLTQSGLVQPGTGYRYYAAAATTTTILVIVVVLLDTDF